MNNSTQFRKIYIEIGNICNLQCTFCPEVERNKLQIAENEFRNLLMQAKPFTEMVCFHVMGEPLAHPQFEKYVIIAEEIGIPVEITTNGTLLNDHLKHVLLQPIIRQVNFSLQSFVDNFPNANITTYLKNIFTFTKLALERRPDLFLNYRLWNVIGDQNKDSINTQILNAIEQEFSISINRNIDVRLNKSKRLLGKLYLHYDSRFEWPNLKNTQIRTRGTCQGTRSHIAIHADGTVVPCCLDKEAKVSLGNAVKEPLGSILSGKRYLAMKEGFQNGNLVEDLCQRCEYSRRFPIP